MDHFHIETPLVYSPEFSQRFGRDVYLKLENLQPSGSFKLRGIGHMMQKAARNGVTEFISTSGGNAGLAAAYCASLLKLPCHIFVPTTTPRFICDKLRTYGSIVHIGGEVWAEADQKAKEYIAIEMNDENNKDKKLFYVPPFDHQDIWTGNSTIVDEIMTQLPHVIQSTTNPFSTSTQPACIAVAVGGGGLFNGICEGLLKYPELKDVPIITSETIGSSCFATAIKNQTPTKVQIDSIATSLGASIVSTQSFEYSKQFNIVPTLVSDAECVVGMCQLHNFHHILVEPACGSVFAALTALFDKEYRMAVENYDPNHLHDSCCQYLSCTIGEDTPASHKTHPQHTKDHLTHRFMDRLIPILKDVKDWARKLPTTLASSNGPIIVIVCGGSIISPQMLRFYQAITQCKHYCERFDVGYGFIEDWEARNKMEHKPMTIGNSIQ